ncbi:MAG: hypothetical protein DRH17_03325 [Deltaproteobacteria bacterium]|nr:MAG: hypothetical protein DRH17_03325 [Deltaproteobacteria bacterium]
MTEVSIMATNSKTNRTKNGKKNETKPAPLRDEKGRFLPGHAGGPGRGKKAEVEGLITEAKSVAADLMKLKDPKLKAMGAKLAVKIETSKKGEPEDAPDVLDPLVLGLVSFSEIIGHFALEANCSELEMLERMLKGCPYCDKFGSGGPDVIKGLE